MSSRVNADGIRNAVDAYMAEEVRPHHPKARADYGRLKVGYEIPVTREFYRYTPPRPVAVIDAEIDALEREIQALLRNQ
jgi:type I restriction enzyme M protein